MKPVICAMGVCHRDVELAVHWLKWVAFLARTEGGSMGNMLVVYTRKLTDAQADSLRSAVDRAYFPATIVACPDEHEHGYPGSASHLFLRTLEQAEKLFPGHAVLWCEPDTVPIKRTWFREFEAEYQTCGKPFLGAKVGTRAPHLSGNAIYPANWRELAPSIASVLTAPDSSEWGPGKGQPWDVWCRKETTPQMAETKLLFQVWKERDVRITRLKNIPPATCLFHQDKTGALIREIATEQYPEFMESLSSGRRYYKLIGHQSRLRAKGHPIKFSFSKYRNHGWVSALCDTELNESDAQAIALMVGRFGISEISEDEFLRLTGRKPATLPESRKSAATTRATVVATHPSVFVMLGRYGDIINVLPMMKAEADAGRRPSLVVSKDFADILDGVSYVDRIVWDGPYDRLPEALRWLRASKGIIAPIIAQYHRHPTDKARLTDSYQIEGWRLAGRLDQFNSNAGVLFDRRDLMRETALRASAGTNIKQPVVLVAPESVSSPLTNIDLVALAREAVGDSAYVVDLRTVRAQRIYDMIDMFDRARLLVTVDTAHLHLARASRVPVIAILNDGWRGSIPPPNTVASFRYLEAGRSPQAIGAAIKATLEKPHEVKTPAVNGHAASGRVFHVVDMFGKAERHRIAQATWPAAYAEGMTGIHCTNYPRDAKSELGHPLSLPFLKDILKAGIDQSSSPADVLIWTNSDVGLAPGAVAAIRNAVGIAGATSMRRTESNGHAHDGRDLFAFTVGWLEKHWDEMPDYIIGVPVFDLGLVAMIRKHAGIQIPTTMASMGQDYGPADMAPGYALHQSHASEWLVRNHHTLPATRRNKSLFVEWARKYAPEIKFTKEKNLI